MKKVVLTAVLGLILGTFAYAQVKPLTDQIGSTKVTASRGADENIIADKKANSTKAETIVVQPPTKGGAPSRGGYCYVTFDNWTGYYIDCYINGTYQGYVAPYGKGSITVSGGDNKVYAVATFDDGSKLTWGPETKSCNNQEWTVSLY